MPSGARSLRIDARRALIPVSLGVLAILHFVLGVPLWVVAGLAILVPLLYLASALYVRREAPRFEDTFNRLLQVSDVKGLTALYRSSRLLRLLAPDHWVLARLGIILTLRGQFREAEGVLEESWELAPKAYRLHLLGPMVRVKYELEAWGDLRALAEQWRQRSLFPGAANVYLAAALLEQPTPEATRARELLDEAEGSLAATERVLCASVRERLEALT
ncbi:MAG: hypothetical protein EA398_03185 [Deltaproteobacteria bacterium]|nr:MAG: hypothetical protein EA398_03185 [Deltaproteobacteria bacterium]